MKLADAVMVFDKPWECWEKRDIHDFCQALEPGDVGLDPGEDARVTLALAIMFKGWLRPTMLQIPLIASADFEVYIQSSYADPIPRGKWEAFITRYVTWRNA